MSLPTGKKLKQLQEIKIKRALAGVPENLSIKEKIDYAYEAKMLVATMVHKDLVPMIERLIAKVKQDGDVMAFNALMDRAHGKPAQAVEMSGKDGAPIVFMPLELMQKHALDVLPRSDELVNSDIKILDTQKTA